MSDDEVFFVTRSGSIWACWLSGKPAVNLGREREVLAAMAQMTGASAPAVRKPAPLAPPATPTPPSPTPEAPKAAPPPAPKVERAKPRHELTILGRIFTVGGSRDVTIRDLSETGCQFADPVGEMSVGARLTIKLGTIGPVESTVRWRRSQNVGVEFNTPLYPSVLEHIRNQFDLRRR